VRGRAACAWLLLFPVASARIHPCGKEICELVAQIECEYMDLR